ncbi:Retrovirus-related Pol polyprotein from transposon [Nosema granulosis]|uniref:Retrovirus-related Pol polyprotein from transposon n=1 Tax=Nosema granulosis TaxID=83296 RepID=A0A9P6GZR6_9MICR|nr:Retrovirus-related Pol polyprotein from transposon [Nosema granulosis]
MELRPCIEAEMPGTKKVFKHLVDSGAEVNLIRPENLQIRMAPEKARIRLRNVSSKVMNPLGICRLTIIINGVTITNDFIITDEINTPCILELPILNKYKVSLKFGEKFECTIGEETKGNRLGKHRILTKCNSSVMAPLYRLSSEKEKMASEFVEKYLKEGIIRPIKSPWRSPIVIAPKKGENGRMCIDFRRLNDVTIKYAYSMTMFEDLIDDFSDARYFSKMDCELGVIKRDEPKGCRKTYFACREGLFELSMMIFGLFNASATL